MYRILALQAADVVAYEAMKFGTRAKPAVIASNFDTECWLLERLKDKMAFLIDFLTAERLELELSERSFEPGRKPGFHFIGCRHPS